MKLFENLNKKRFTESAAAMTLADRLINEFSPKPDFVAVTVQYPKSEFTLEKTPKNQSYLSVYGNNGILLDKFFGTFYKTKLIAKKTNVANDYNGVLVQATEIDKITNPLLELGFQKKVSDKTDYKEVQYTKLVTLDEIKTLIRKIASNI